MQKKRRVIRGLCVMFILCISMSIAPMQVYAGIGERIKNQNSNMQAESLIEVGPIHVDKNPNLSGLELQKAPSTKNGFYKKMKENMLKRSTNFSVSYLGNINDVLIQPLDMIEKVRCLDDRKTSDDGDFLAGSVTYISYSAQYSNTAAVFQFAISYTENAKQVKKVNTEVAKVLKKLNVSELSDVGKIKAIHDYIVNLVQYDVTMQDHSAFGGLVDQKHTTVCQGYALLMYKMLTEAGITAHYVTGYAGENHAWNVVKVNGKWYYLDATWDDPISTQPILSHQYFLIGAKKLRQDHTINSIYAKLYKPSENDLDWRTALKKSSNKKDQKLNKKETKEQKKTLKNVELRNQYVSELNRTLDQMLNYKKATTIEQSIYDLYKKVIATTGRNLSDKKFDLLLSGDDAFINEYITICMDKLDHYIMDPFFAYLDSDEYLEDVQKLMLCDYTEKQICNMSDKEIDQLSETYCFEAANNKVHHLSSLYTDKIIEECVKKLEAYRG